MPTYAVKIGEIRLVSDKPVTRQDVEFALTALKNRTLDQDDLSQLGVQLVPNRPQP